MSFPKDYHITEADVTVQHAVARALHEQQSALTKQRKLRKLPKNMDLLKKARAIAGTDLIMSAGDSKKAFLVAYFGSAVCGPDHGLGFGLGIDAMVIGPNGEKHTNHHTIAAVSSHAAARILGRTVHSADRSALREVMRPAFLVITKMWIKEQATFKSLVGHDVAVITPTGALLGRVTGKDEAQFQFLTWVDAMSAAGVEIPNLCHACSVEGHAAIVTIRDNNAWRRLDELL